MTSLRPTKLADIIGQVNVKECINILVNSAKRRGDVLPHICCLGPAGTGKTTFARAIANEMRSNILLANGGNIQSIKDIMPYVLQLKQGDILFVDEVHRIAPKVQECLYTVMEDFRLDVKISFNVKPFTFIGATTEEGMLLKPFYDRFVVKLHLEPYSIEELSSIIQYNAAKLKLQLSSLVVENIAERSRGTPRIANSYLIWLRDYIVSQSIHGMTVDQLNQAMKLRGIDERGLNHNDRLYMGYLKGKSRPMGLQTIASATGLSTETIQHTIEPWLLRLGIIEKTTRGRQLV